MPAHQFLELLAVAADAERVREAERHLAAALMRDACRLQERLLGLRRIPEIALEIDHLGVGDHCRPDLVRRQVDARSEEHTSELQSLMRNSYAVFCLKKKNNTSTKTRTRQLFLAYMYQS